MSEHKCSSSFNHPVTKLAYNGGVINSLVNLGGTMRLNIIVGLFLVLLAGSAVAETNLNGAGATFPYPVYSKWYNEYHKAHPDVQINYQSIGSGGGIKQLQARTVDFGASDGPMSTDQLDGAPAKILHFPTVLGGVVPIYNIDGISAKVNFTQKAI